MSPTLNPTFSSTGYRDLLLFSRPRPHTPLRRGDIVEFYTPVDATKKSVKRIIALPGDTVVLDPRRRPTRRRDGGDVPGGVTEGWDSWVGGRVEVPAGHLWVEGDNWRESRDSNWYGPVSRGLVTGKAMKILWRQGEEGWWRELARKKGETRVEVGKGAVEGWVGVGEVESG